MKFRGRGQTTEVGKLKDVIVIWLFFLSSFLSFFFPSSSNEFIAL